MSTDNKAHARETRHSIIPSDYYISTDAVGRRHIIKAGENGVTTEWIEDIRTQENRNHCSNYRFYHRWNGKEYVRVVLSMDSIDPDSLEHYPSMIDPSPDPLTQIIEREEKEIQHHQYHAAFKSLTEKQRLLIHKRCDLGLTFLEIARQEGVSSVAIFKRWKRIMRKIRKFFV